MVILIPLIVRYLHGQHSHGCMTFGPNSHKDLYEPAHYILPVKHCNTE